MMIWRGVFPAITTPFQADLSLDLALLHRQIEGQIAAGCRGIVPLGSLGEGASLALDEKMAVIDTCVAAAAGRVPVVAGIAAPSTRQAIELAALAEEHGCLGLMLLPPQIYVGDARETTTFFETLLRETPLPCMLYNNPIAYRTDVLPEQIEHLCEFENLQAVKESSADVRRVSAIRALCQDRIAVFIGVDDLIVEGIAAGAVGWIAGLVDALPHECVRLFDLAIAGRTDEARALYQWFLPLLRLDTVPKFVHLIKLVQEEVGIGTSRLRPPRLPLAGEELEAARQLIRGCLAHRPALDDAEAIAAR
jgi:dihydrodipicolinate synthase/N-acetylneuraminate lyase